jgi:2-polyprenyl-6-methoxyphenol hydroxylase-like FAD-dependent oxidoreductase
LNIKLSWKDYGTFSGVADIEAEVPNEETKTSWIELNPKRPVGLFGFHPNKWRIIYRVNSDETREQASTNQFVHNILKTHFPYIHNYKILWVSCFRLGQGQSANYFKQRIVLAGDAAHPMGPSAGAGMMVGMLGVWRLAFRLRKIIHETNMEVIRKTLSDYERDQIQGSKTIQQANAFTFFQISITNGFAGWLRNFVIRVLAQLPFVKRKMVRADTLTNQTVYYEDYQ